jgi:phosphoglucosamine mutase
VVLAGVVPTPAVAFLTTGLGVSAGVVISASHNPPQDNGIKLFGARGFKLSDALEDEIEVQMGRTEVGTDRPGRILDMPADAPSYVDHVVGTAEARLAGLKVVVDCANGAASELGPVALRRLGAEVVAIHAEPNGSNINVGCGATMPEVVAEMVLAHGADAGVTFDGDADRALFADEKGAVIDGDQVLAACAIRLQETGALAGDTLVATVMSNLGLHRAMSERGIAMLTAPVGDRYVLEQMMEHDVALGGEQSGHVIFRDHATTGDGLITSARYLSLAAVRGVRLSELASVMHRFPQILVNVEVAHRELLGDARDVWDAVRAAEDELGADGRVLVRPSGTEPLVRVMVEAETEGAARRHSEAVAAAIAAALA